MERTVAQVAEISGVSVRTLHHYDHIGLLRPSTRSPAGYRLYRREDLLRLQEILLWRSLGLPLDRIAQLLDKGDRDPVATLMEHRLAVEKEIQRLERTLKTLDQTIGWHKKEHDMLTDEELYEGIKPETAAAWREEARETWDPALVQASEDRVKQLGKEGWARVRAEGEAATLAWAAAMQAAPVEPAGALAQAAARGHHQWLRNFYEPDAGMLMGLGQLYVDDPRFTETYDRHAPGLAVFIRDALMIYARNMKV